MSPFGLASSPLLTAAESRALDQAIVRDQDLTGYDLMVAASTDIFSAIRDWRPSLGTLYIFCGTGNNGGDGWVIARLAREAGLRVQVELVGDAARITGDAAQAHAAYLDAGGIISESSFSLDGLNADDVIVDAILGTGLRGQVREHQQRAIERINAARASVVAIDCPSGLSADTGAALPQAVRADITLTVIASKQGLYTGDAVDAVGELVYLPVVSAQTQIAALDPKAELLELALDVAGSDSRRARHPAFIHAKRARNSHKGQFGRILVVAGNTGMAGAALLATEAALRSGAGLVSLASRADTVSTVLLRRPEVMAHNVTHASILAPLLQATDVVVVGPGLGQDDWAAGLLGQVLDARIPTVIDADALNLINQVAGEQSLHSGCILTPHPGEAASLLGLSTREVMADRFHACRMLAERWNAVTVLKGAGTVIAEAGGQRVAVCPCGNPGMATAGSGDVLAGIMGTLLAQVHSAPRAAALGCCIHAIAGDRVAAKRGMAGLVAADIIDELGPLMDAVTAS